MSQELDLDENKEPDNKPQEQEVDPFIQRATEMGWRPKEEFDGDEVDFVDAKEYVQRAPLFDTIKSSKKRIDKLEQTIKALTEHNQRIEESAYKRALNDLKAKQAEALEDGDLQQYHKIGTQIEEVKENRPQPVKAEASPTNPAFDTWVEKNTWYNKSADMRAFADAIGINAHQDGHSPEEVLKIVEQKVRSTFPNEFRNPNRERAGVEGRSGTKANSAKEDNFQLSDMERNIMNTLVRSGVMSKEEYVKQLKSAQQAGD